ncbi:MAG TPA: HNH endonuclease signature motif containing protein [Agitococcus sp.]|mgnify:CR=1 FL=1|nr:HNH endonuclease signature motif containing protein [Agitococcus sp.]
MAFSEDTKLKVWAKGTTVTNYNASTWRKDQCGAWMHYPSYGDRNSKYGWEIDHIKTKANGGGDELSNLRPLQWENNVAKSDGNLKCVITSNGDKNVAKT